MYRASDCRSAPEKSTIEPSFEPPAVSGEPTTSDGSTVTCDTATTSDGAPVGWMSIARAVARARSGRRRRSRARCRRRASRRRSRQPHRPQRRRRRSLPARQLVPANGRRIEPPKIEWTTRRSKPLVRLGAERVERERAGVAALVADRGDAALARPAAGGAASRSGRRSRAAAALRGAGGRRSPAPVPRQVRPSRRTRTGAPSRAPRGRSRTSTARRRRRRSRWRCRRRVARGHAGGATGGVATPGGQPGPSGLRPRRVRPRACGRAPAPRRLANDQSQSGWPDRHDASGSIGSRERSRPPAAHPGAALGPAGRPAAAADPRVGVPDARRVTSSSSSWSPGCSRCCSIRSSGRCSGPVSRAASRSRSCYLAFASALVLVIVAIATAVVGETKTAANRFNDYFTNRSRADRTDLRRPRRRSPAALARTPTT